MKSLFGKVAVGAVAIVAIVVALAGLVLIARILLVPFVVALFVAYLFEPGVAGLERRGVDRGHSYLLFLALTMIGVGTLLAYTPGWVMPDAAPAAAPAPQKTDSQEAKAAEESSGAQTKPQEAVPPPATKGKNDKKGATPAKPRKEEQAAAVEEQHQEFTDRITEQLNKVEAWAVKKAPMLRSMQLAKEISERAADVAKRLFEELPGLITSFTVNLLLVPFIAYFMVRDGRSLKRRIIQIVPNRYFEMSLIVFDKVDGQIGGYLRGRLIECILVGVTQMVVMGAIEAFFNVPQPQILLLAVVCGVTNVIPYVGPVLGSAFGVFLYLGTGGSSAFISCGGFLAAVAVTHVLDNIVIAPAVLSHNVDLHPLTVALVLVIGGELLGVLGLLIAIPVAASLKVIASEFYNNYRAQAR